MFWVVVTNSNFCRIYNYSKNPVQISLLKTIEHPESRLKDTDLISDRSGHYKTMSSTRGSYEQRTDPKKNEIDQFAHDIANELETARNNNACDQIIIIASPQMSGLLFQHFNKHLKKLIRNNIQKELLYTNQDELLDFLHTHAQFSDKV